MTTGDDDDDDDDGDGEGEGVMIIHYLGWSSKLYFICFLSPSGVCRLIDSSSFSSPSSICSHDCQFKAWSSFAAAAV